MQQDLRKLEEWYLGEIHRGTLYHASAPTKSKGVMIGISKRLPWICEKKEMHPHGRYIIWRGGMGQRYMIIVGIYGPNTEFWDNMKSTLFNVQNQDIIILGDFNVVINKDLD